MPVKKTTTTTSVVKQENLFNTTQMNMKLFKLVETLSKHIDSLQTTQETFNTNFVNLQGFSQEQLNEIINWDFEKRYLNPQRGWERACKKKSFLLKSY